MPTQVTSEMSIFETIYNCRAMRRLKSDEVPEELILKLIEAANQAPCGGNSQRGRWIVVRDAEQRAAVAKLNREGVMAYLPAGSGTAESQPQRSADKHQRMIDSVLWQVEHMHEIPVLIIACFLFDEEPSLEYRADAAGSIWPGVQNLLLAARALGLGAAPTTLGLGDRKATKEVLGLPPELEAYCLIPVGWPMGKFGPVTRMPVAETLRWDRWGSV